MLILIASPARWAALMPGEHLVEPAPARDLREFRRIERVERDVDPPHPRRPQILGIAGELAAVGGERQLVERARLQVPAERPEQGHDAAPHQRLAAGETQLAHAQPHEGGAHAVELFQRQNLGFGQEGHVFRHAIDAAKVAPIRDGDAEIADVPAERINHGTRLGQTSMATGLRYSAPPGKVAPLVGGVVPALAPHIGAHQYHRMEEFTVRPNPDDPRLTRTVEGMDQEGKPITTAVVIERPLTLFLNGQEIVTMMTVGDHPDYLAVGYLLNQSMLRADDAITAIDYDEELETVVVRTKRRTDYEKKLRKKTLTSGCAQGTVFGDLMEKFETIRLPEDAVLRTSWLYALARKINTAPSLYLAAGAIHGCVLCEEDRPLVYMEDVGRHNAIDKIAGYMHINRIGPGGKIFYTTGRLTSEMVIKTVQMRIPILISRSGFTAWGVDLARQAGLTLIGRAKGKRFVALAGEGRIVFDDDPRAVADEAERFQRKASLAEGSA